MPAPTSRFSPSSLCLCASVVDSGPSAGLAACHDCRYDVEMKGRIELELHEPNQLFNSMDPSPFVDRDLDGDAEEFILNWAQEYSHREQLSLTIHLEHMPAEDPTAWMAEAVHNFFSYRANLNRLAFRRLMDDGQTSLLVGLAFLTGCLAIRNLVLGRTAGAWAGLLRESLTIVGWVAMWRPVQIYLHEWWPLWRRGRTLNKLSAMPVEVVQKTPRPGLAVHGELPK